MANKIEKEYEEKIYPELIVPVPLHEKRLIQRGYNQSLLLAKILSHHLKVPLSHQDCQRIKNTTAQSSLKEKARKKNLKQAFTLKAQPAIEHIALVDDVITTGATLNELSKVYKNAGVKRIDIWICARALL